MLFRLLLLMLLGGCAAAPQLPPVAPPVAPPAVLPPPAPALLRGSWNAVVGWTEDDPGQAWDAFLQSCAALKSQPAWQPVCNAAPALQGRDSATLRAFFEANFTPYQVSNPDGSSQGLVTGYYEPQLQGSRHPSARYSYPLYAAPEDLLVIDLSAVYPELKNMRLRGRLQGNRVTPYYNRAEIEHGDAPLKGREILWVDDPIDLFFLQIEGSGRVVLDNGKTVRVGYADQNGYPYKSIGRVLVERGEMPLERASMQGIKEWTQKNPDKLTELLNQNASYVFFREMPNHLGGPLGALGVPLTAGRSIAVDARTIPLGAPVFLATTWPNSDRPLNRLMLAQDTGGAIRGAVRADFFWGFGGDSAAMAGSMRQSGKMWVLLPQGYAVP
jgi:membrane-bound lytic murein transglycosylase A